jgi:hypothetical protein
VASPTRYADSDGVSIAYQVHGDGPVDLVFVAGFVFHVEAVWGSTQGSRGCSTGWRRSRG